MTHSNLESKNYSGSLHKLETRKPLKSSHRHPDRYLHDFQWLKTTGDWSWPRKRRATGEKSSPLRKDESGKDEPWPFERKPGIIPRSEPPSDSPKPHQRIRGENRRNGSAIWSGIQTERRPAQSCHRNPSKIFLDEESRWIGAFLELPQMHIILFYFLFYFI